MRNSILATALVLILGAVPVTAQEIVCDREMKVLVEKYGEPNFIQGSISSDKESVITSWIYTNNPDIMGAVFSERSRMCFVSVSTKTATTHQNPTRGSLRVTRFDVRPYTQNF